MTGKLLTLAALAAFGTIPLTAAPVTWVDWISGTPGSTGSATGILHLGAVDVTVNYSGEIAFIQTSGGTNYWTEPNPSLPPYTSALVDNAPPASDIIALQLATVKTLTFSQPINNLFFAVVSLNGNGYRFDQDFNIVSDGCGYWGCGSLVKDTSVPGQYDLDAGTDLGSEPHGVIQFTGAVSSISWSSLTNENWNGFTVGTYGLASSVPEPGTIGFLAMGFGLLPFLRRRARRGTSL